MTMRRMGFLLIAIFALAAGDAAASAVPRDCWGVLKPSLERGGFSGDLACEYYAFNLKYVGRTSGRWTYRVYMYDYTIPAVEGGPGHGGSRILIFDDHSKYLGQYSLNDTFHGIWITGSTVHFGYAAKWGNVLKLNGPHPPWVAWFLGDQVTLYK